MGLEICAKCYCWVEVSKNTMVNRVGQCRRLPPQVVYDTEVDGEANVWPTTRDSDWCAEFMPIKGDDSNGDKE